MKRKILCFTLAFSMLLESSSLMTVYAESEYYSGNTTNNYNTDTTKEANIIDAPVTNKWIICEAYDDNAHLKNVGINRGDYQIREVIPYEISAGETITIWQASGTGQEDLTAELKGHLSTNDSSAVVSKDGMPTTITAREDSVVYIKLPRRQFNDITVSYSITRATTLPIFTQDVTNQAQFFQDWDVLGTSNAILQNKSVVLQVPTDNKEYLRNLQNYGNFTSINQLLEYYHQMVLYYDYLSGLDGTQSYNKSPSQRYFALADMRDIGKDVEYSTDQVRAYGSSLGMKNILDDTWVAKREFAQGYESDIVKNEPKLENVWNDVYAHYYSMVANSNDRSYATSYLANKDIRQREVFERADFLSVNNTVNSYFTLGFFTELFDEYGLDLLTKFNQEYRKLGMSGEHDDIPTVDLMVKSFSKNAKVDFGAYFESYGFNIDQDILDENAELSNVYFVTDLVRAQDKIDYLMSRYGLESRYGLIDTSIFATDPFFSTVTGDAQINITIDNIAELKGKQILLKNGKNEYTAAIEGKVANFEDIPVGVYNLYTPLTNSGDYEKTNSSYIVITENGKARESVAYDKLNDYYLNFDYDFKVLTNRNYVPMDATLSYVDDGRYNLEVNTYKGIINTETNGKELYGYIKVYDPNSRIVSSKELFNNTDQLEQTTNTTLRPGYKIFLYRTGFDNKKLVKSNVTGEEFFDTSTELMVFEVGPDGLVYQGQNIRGEEISAIVSLDENTEKTSTGFVDYSSGQIGAAIVNDYVDGGNLEQFETKDQYIYSNMRIYLKNAINHYGSDEATKKSIIAQNVQNLRLNNPVLTVGYTTIDVPINQPLDIKGYATATDVEDGDISELVTIDQSKVNVNQLGSYPAIIKVEDSDHNYDSQNVIIRVVNSNEVKTKPGGSDNPNFGSTGSGSVSITGRQAYPTKTSNVEAIFPEVTNRNQIVPFYYNGSNQKVIAKYSAYENGDITLVDTTRGMYSYNYMPNVINFKDTTSTWGKSSIDFVTARGIIGGVSDKEFAPKTQVSRAMIATILGRLSDVNVNKYVNTFADVSDSAWYDGYVAWATTEGIMSGVDATHFNPNGLLTREEFAVVTYNYLKSLGYEVNVTNQVKFADDAKISESAKTAVYALRELGLVKGDTLNLYNPKSTLTREELSAILERVVRLAIDTEEAAN